MGQAARVWGAGNRTEARHHREGQLKRGVPPELGELSPKQRNQLLDYIKRHSKNMFACQHLLKVSKRVPHPRYGDKVPHFEESYVPDPTKCPCPEAQRFRTEIGI
jgi:hypothetical protein